MLRFLCALFSLSLVVTPNTFAEFSPSRVPAEIAVDGVLDESIWSDAPILDSLTVINPDTMALPSQATQVQVVYDDSGIYFAVSCYQPYETQVERLTARDNDVERDSIQLVLDTSGSGLYGYLFKVGLGGSLVDGTVRSERNFAYEWNTPWLARTSRHTDRWDLEVFIPWRGLTLPSATDHRTIGLSVERRVSYLAESWAVPALSHNRNVFLSALLPMNIDVFEPKRELTFVPYLSINEDRLKGSNEQNYGFDLYYQPTSDSKLALTVSPDFGMVENDDIVVNFSAFEVFLPERRDFFLEDQDIFNHRGTGRVVNTRRIGASPDRPQLEEGQSIAERPGLSDIVAAGKFTGQAGNLRYGVMSALEDDSTFILNDGGRATVDGRKFLAVRSLYDVSNGDGHLGTLGYLGTLTQHSDHNASTHMLDGDYRSADERWQWYAQWLNSSIENIDGYGQFIQAKYSPKVGLLHTFELSHIDRNLDLNDLGFLNRNDRNRFYYAFDHPDITDSKNYKIWDPRGWFAYEENNDGERLLLRAGIWQTFTFNDLTRLNLTVQYTAPAWNDRNSRGNGSYRTDDNWHVQSNWQSDRSQPLSYAIDSSLTEAQIRGTIARVKPSIRYSPTDTITIDAELQYREQDNWQLWRGANRIDSFESKQINTTIKTTWIVDDAQEIRLAIRWLGLQAKAGEPYRINDNGELYESGEARSRNFTRADLALQIRYKYQFAPLSDLYLVYSKGGRTYTESEGDIDGFSDLVSASIREETANQLILKIRYRI